jgi:hypothetical protein
MITGLLHIQLTGVAFRTQVVLGYFLLRNANADEMLPGVALVAADCEPIVIADIADTTDFAIVNVVSLWCRRRGGVGSRGGPWRARW